MSVEKMLPPRDGEGASLPKLGAPKPPSFGKPRQPKTSRDLSIPDVPGEERPAGREKRTTRPEELWRTIPVPSSRRPDAPGYTEAPDWGERRRAGLFFAENFLRVHSIMPPPEGMGRAVARPEDDPEYALNLRPLVASAVEEVLHRNPELTGGLQVEEIVDRLFERGIAQSRIFPARSRVVPIHHLDAEHVGRFYDGVIAFVSEAMRSLDTPRE